MKKKKPPTVRWNKIRTPMQVEFAQSLGVLKPIKNGGHMSYEETAELFGVSEDEVRARTNKDDE
jgi:hypothetical protein